MKIISIKNENKHICCGELNYIALKDDPCWLMEEDGNWQAFQMNLKVSGVWTVLYSKDYQSLKNLYEDLLRFMSSNSYKFLEISLEVYGVFKK